MTTGRVKDAQLLYDVLLIASNLARMSIWQLRCVDAREMLRTSDRRGIDTFIFSIESEDVLP